MQSPRNSIASGHCLIVPMEHIPSTRVADDNTNIELRNFKKSLIHMFAAEGKTPIFVELAKGNIILFSLVLAAFPFF